MLLILRLFNEYYQNYTIAEPKPPTTQWPFVSSPLPVSFLTAAYLLFIYKIGPEFMKNRPAYNLKNVLLLYNFIQVVLNFCIGIFAIHKIVSHYYVIPGLICSAQLPIEHMLKPLEIKLCYVYYLMKILDYLDTIFFVLRKSFKQITFLHVYHHVLMANGCCFYLRLFGPGGQQVSMGVLNTFVHGFMYGYYFIAALRPNMKNTIWWKKYITRLQIAQFIIVFLHHMAALLLRPQCSVPKFLLYFGSLQALVMLLLFINFYIKAYVKPIYTRNSVQQIVHAKTL